MMYLLAIILVLVNFPILFLVGGYVSHTALPPLESALVALAGPLTNLILWAIFFSLIKLDKIKKYRREIYLMAKINLFLFIFNMLPIPGFDGYHFFRALWQVFF